MKKDKIFGIGLNKTGTSSLGKYFKSLGYNLYCNPSYNNILKAKNEINEIYKIVDKFDVFEDWPWPLIYKELYNKYPRSKFILTIRGNAEEWFDSLFRHSKRTGHTKQRLFVYGHYNPDKNNKIDHVNIYNNHYKNVINFFKKNNPYRLLILSTNDLDKEKKIYKFIGINYNKNNYIKYSHQNKDYNKILCDHEFHGCQETSFIWINHSNKNIYLEVPKNASKFIKENLKGYIRLSKKDYLKHIDGKYNDYFVFTIFRDLEDRIISTYKYFCISSNRHRIKQMSSLFKLTKNEIENLSFSEFLNYAIKYKDHHWNSQIKYMYLKKRKKKPLIYNFKDLNKLFKKIGIPLNLNPKNISKNYKINITDEDRKLIKILYKKDYENINLINKYM